MSLGEAIIDADVTLTGVTAFDPAGGASLVASLKFFVEEEEMLVDHKVLCTVHHSVADGIIDYTRTLDGADIAPLADGLGRLSAPSVATQETQLAFERTLRVPQGEHTLQLHLKSPAGNIVVEGATWNGWLTARRHSHPATNAANANSKQSTGIY